VFGSVDLVQLGLAEWRDGVLDIARRDEFVTASARCSLNTCSK
jgi:hypothetical protein